MPPWDSTIGLRADPYRFVMRTARLSGGDAFETRLLLERAVLLTGPEAGRFFYDRSLFRREGAAPGFLTATLFGKGGVQGLDGAPHHRRKAMFLSLLGPGRFDDLTRRGVASVAAIGTRRGRVVLQDAFEEALTGAVCDWAGIPLDPSEVPDLARMLSHLFEHAASVGPGQVAARFARHRTERWAASLIRRVRAGTVTAPDGSALAILAQWQDETGARLPARVAAVELLNILRPYVAISAYLTFLGHAMVRNPVEAGKAAGDPQAAQAFVQEVRRLAPFFPLVAARAARATSWHGIAIPKWRLVGFDLYGTNRDPAVWTDPETFRPERFLGGAEPGAFDLVPQGGGAHETGHRCAGEWATIDLMVAVLPVLHGLTDWRALPEQDLTLDMRALPALPRDRLVIEPRPA